MVGGMVWGADFVIMVAYLSGVEETRDAQWLDLPALEWNPMGCGSAWSRAAAQ